MAKKKCIDCDYRFKVGKSPRCNPCRRKRERDTRHDAHLRKTYGITIGDYYAMFEAQEGSCAICIGGTSKNYLSCDHDHKTGEVRGLLCANCNKRLLPAAKNRVSILLKAIDYLRDHPARAVLESRDWTEWSD